MSISVKEPSHFDTHAYDIPIYQYGIDTYGHIYLRVYKGLVKLDGKTSQIWSWIDRIDNSQFPNTMVRVLLPGTKITIEIE